ncbi:MAG: metal-dependent hydrolase [Myxococcota bacterium]
MDGITHTLFGLALAELGFLRRLGAGRARALSVVAANVPDVDVMLLLASRERYVLDHDGATHGLVSLALLPPLMGRLALLGTPRSPAAVRAATALAALALAGHLLLDLLTSRGAMVLWPLAQERVALDWLHDPDPVVAVLLLLTWALRVGPLPGPRAAAGSILVVGLYVGLQGAAHGVVLKRASAWARLEGLEVEAAFAFPERPGGLWWSTVAVNDEEALHRYVDLLGPARLGLRLPRGLEEPLVEEFLATSLGARWLEWSRVPMAASVELPDGRYEVWVRDLRFNDRFHGAERGARMDLRARFDPAGQMREHTWFLDEPPWEATPLPAIPPLTPGRAP